MRIHTMFAAAVSLFAAALPAAAAAETAAFTINTALNGVNVPGAPTTATITGRINYSTFFAGPAGGSSAVTDFNVFLLGNGQNYNVGNYSPFASGINSVLTLTSGQTGTLDFNANAGGSPLFSFDLTGLFTANGQGALPGGGVTLTNQTQIDGTTIFAGSPGTLAVAAVPEPAAWGLLIGGFGLVGFSARRRTTTKVIFA